MEETHTVNMTGSNGVFALSIGAGARVSANDAGFTMVQILSNSAILANAKLNCSGNSYTPSSGDGRQVKLSFNPGSGYVSLTPNQTITAVPFAVNALNAVTAESSQKIQGSTLDTSIGSLSSGDVDKVLKWDGTKWLASATPNGITQSNTPATCTTGDKGKQRFNDTYNNMQFCDGSYWREVGFEFYASSRLCIPAENLNDEMVPVGNYCVDKYEASVWSDRAATGTAYFTDGTSGDYNYASNAAPNFNRDGTFTSTPKYYAVSKAGVMPSRGITWFQAVQTCAASGKELIPDSIWQMAAAGTVDPGASSGTGGTSGGSATDAVAAKCNTSANGGSGNWTISSGGARYTNRAGATLKGATACISQWGAQDMVGNLWEWTNYQGQAGVKTGTAFAQGEAGSPLMLGKDDKTWNLNGSAYGYNGTTYAWLNNAPAAAVRGGVWHNGVDGGVFALILYNAPSNSHWAFGFRCARRR
jgi:formylglycine-generating enzyme required for sulfatase activity